MIASIVDRSSGSFGSTVEPARATTPVVETVTSAVPDIRDVGGAFRGPNSQFGSTTPQKRSITQVENSAWAFGSSGASQTPQHAAGLWGGINHGAKKRKKKRR